MGEVTLGDGVVVQVVEQDGCTRIKWNSIDREKVSADMWSRLELDKISEKFPNRAGQINTTPKDLEEKIQRLLGTDGAKQSRRLLGRYVDDRQDEVCTVSSDAADDNEDERAIALQQIRTQAKKLEESIIEAESVFVGIPDDLFWKQFADDFRQHWQNLLRDREYLFQLFDERASIALSAKPQVRTGEPESLALWWFLSDLWKLFEIKNRQPKASKNGEFVICANELMDWAQSNVYVLGVEYEQRGDGKKRKRLDFSRTHIARTVEEYKNKKMNDSHRLVMGRWWQK